MLVTQARYVAPSISGVSKSRVNIISDTLLESVVRPDIQPQPHVSHETHPSVIRMNEGG